MPLVHIDGTGQITWHMSVAGTSGEAVCTMGIQTSQNNVDDAAIKARMRWESAIMPMLSARCLLVKATVMLHLAGNNEVGESFSSPAHAGSASSAMLPANCAVLVQKRTNFAGRKNRGRFYLPGIDTSFVANSVDSNALTASNLTAFQAAADALYAGLKDSDDGDALNPVILHPASSTTVTAVTAFSVQARLATQRGRLRD